MKIAGKSNNWKTGVVHGITGRKIGPLKLHERCCGGSTTIWDLKADDKPIDCMKCRSMMTEKQREDNDAFAEPDSKRYNYFTAADADHCTDA